MDDGTLLTIAGMEASISLGLHLQQPEQYMILLTGTRHAKLQAMGRGGFQETGSFNPQGMPYDNGIDECIQTALQDKSCWGFVPLTGEAQEALQRNGVTSQRTGMGLDGNQGYVAYVHEPT